MKMAIDGEEKLGFILNPKRSRRYPAEVITDLDYADDIALIGHEIAQAKKLQKIDSTAMSTRPK